MEWWGIEITDVNNACQEYPEILLLQSKPNLLGRLMGRVMLFKFFQGKFPPGFRSTMEEADLRLPEMEMGLGIITDDIKRFYPRNSIKDVIKDDIGGCAIEIHINSSNNIPYAVCSDGKRPIQLFSRWYGFSYAFPGCEIFMKE